MEKRELASGALAPDFGDAGSIELSFGGHAVHSAAEHAMGHGLAIDADHLYLGGTGFGVEKRRLRDGAPAESFGVAGLARSEAAQDSVATSIALRGGILYAAGPENGEDVRLEARAADSGELMYVQTEDFADAGCGPQCVAMAAARDDALYLATTTSAGRWRIEKRDRAHGELVYAKELPASAGCDGAMALAVDILAMYVVGSYEQRWRIEKRSLVDGELVQSFGSGGVIDPGIGGAANSVLLHDGLLYVAGLEGPRDGVQSSVWRMQRFVAEDGAMRACPAGSPAVPRAPECASTPRIANAPLTEAADCVERRASANACAAATVRGDPRAGTYGDWVLPEGAAVVDGSFASVELSSQPSSMLLLRGFGFDLPESARVLGLTVHVTHAGEGAVADEAVRLVREWSTVWGDRSSSNPWSSSSTSVSYGGERDLWGWNWSAQELNSPSFGVALRARALDAPARAQVDAVRVEVHYCE
ncbi:MAG TPA: hypothetical protein VJV78_32520 [Polyangiales bacterium]|nr:hypothetical protein [Polyangiales bacterium]